MEKEFDKFDDDDDLEEFDKNLLESEDFEESAPVVRDYSQRQILIWEEDDVRREACLEDRPAGGGDHQARKDRSGSPGAARE